jgi:hypothetical protein
MIRDDDFDCLGIEIAGERLVVWTDWGMQKVILPHAPRDTAEVIGSLIQSHRRNRPRHVTPKSLAGY